MKVILNRDVITEKFCTDLDIFYGFKKYKSNAGLAYYYYKTSDYNVIKYLSFKDTEILLNGNDLIKLGYPKGRLFKDVIEKGLLPKKTFSMGQAKDKRFYLECCMR